MAEVSRRLEVELGRKTRSAHHVVHVHILAGGQREAGRCLCLGQPTRWIEGGSAWVGKGRNSSAVLGMMKRVHTVWSRVSLIPATRLVIVIVIVQVLLLILALLVAVFPATSFACLALAVPFVAGTLRDVDPPVTALSGVVSRSLLKNKHGLKGEIVSDGSLATKP